MTELLLLKDHKKRPSLEELFKMKSMKERMKMLGYDFDEHLAEIARAKSGGAEPVKAASKEADSRGKLLLANARGAEPQVRKTASASAMDVKKEPAKPIRGSVPVTGSGPPAGRAQKNEQKYNQALKSAMKSGDDLKE